MDATNGTGGADDATAAEPAGTEGEADATAVDATVEAEADAADAEDEPTA